MKLNILLLLLVAVVANAHPEKNNIDLPQIGEEVSLSKTKEICEHFHLSTLWEKIEKNPPMRPFKSDGCTHWVNEWKGVNIYSACFVHDLKYWAGYPNEEVERLIADAELMIDVAKLLNSTKMAETMFFGVRIGGNDTFKRPYSWGFGRF